MTNADLIPSIPEGMFSDRELTPAQQVYLQSSLREAMSEMVTAMDVLDIPNYVDGEMRAECKFTGKKLRFLLRFVRIEEDEEEV